MIAGASRGIRLPEALGIPIIGRVAAGNPVLAQEHVEDYCTLPNSFFSPRADFFLRVQGDSMIEIGIFDDDLLAVHSTALANDGDVIVARIDNEVTVKRLRKTNQKHLIELLPENKDYRPIKVDLREQEFAVEGLSVGVLRNGL
ncbi:UNVERIFIED_CONTAM: hypothetical protein GTU68_009722 [Idotea baltica]|nr:hypothetical protein [Idotea baltica]